MSTKGTTLVVGDRVRPEQGCVAAGQIGNVTDINAYGVKVTFNGTSVWTYAEDMLQKMCPFCPDWDECYPISHDFFGGPCEINGMACCEVCYNVHAVTHKVLEADKELSDSDWWKKRARACKKAGQS